MRQNIDFWSIKLIIWDLDDTLWEGTLSEGTISMPPQHIKLLQNITDAGVINSICSKNNNLDVEVKLNELGILDFFVFKSINWDNKGHRIKQIIDNMALRSSNVLFIDDNVSNLNEAAFYNKDLQIATPEIMPQLIDFYSNCEKKDLKHNRLNQYKVLESKRFESLQFESNEDFLRSCNITLQIHSNCIDHIDRLHELVLRTNQLNFTKKRPTLDEFRDDLKCLKCGYITVQDRFGDYGTVGFYALNNENTLEHFLFSCRTIGQGIEQYIYWKLNFPKINIIGEVATTLSINNKPNWITETTHIPASQEPVATDVFTTSSKYLFKGPCDMSSMVGYLRLGNNIRTEFTFNDDLGHSIENHNHSAHIYALKTLSKQQFDTLFKECFFLDMPNFRSDIFADKYNIIFLSTLIEGNYGLYRRIETGEVVAYGHYDYPLTDQSYWEKYINQLIPTYNYVITKQNLVEFSKKYEYIGRTNTENYIKFLDFLLDNTHKDTDICLILGSEIAYGNETESTYNDRYLFHKNLNSAIKAYATLHSRVKYIELTKYIKSQNDFTNNINHFKPNIYYAFAKDILKIIKEKNSSENISSSYKRYIYKRYIQPIRSVTPEWLIDILRPLYRLLVRKENK